MAYDRAAESVVQAIVAARNGHATPIQTSDNAILGLLARICDPMTGIKQLWDVLTEEDGDEIARIAADATTVVDTFAAQQLAGMSHTLTGFGAQAVDLGKDLWRYSPNAP